MEVAPVPGKSVFSMRTEAFADIEPNGPGDSNPFTHFGAYNPRRPQDSCASVEEAAEVYGGKVAEARSNVSIQCYETPSTTRPMMSITWGFQTDASVNGMTEEDTSIFATATTNAKGAAAYRAKYRPVESGNGVTCHWRIRIMNMASITRTLNLPIDAQWKVACKIDEHNFVRAFFNPDHDRWYMQGQMMKPDTTFETIDRSSEGPSLPVQFFNAFSIHPEEETQCELWMGDSTVYWEPHGSPLLSKLNHTGSAAAHAGVIGYEDTQSHGCAGFIDAQLIEMNAI